MTSGQVQTNSSTATAIVPAANLNTIYARQGSPRTVVLTNVDATNDVFIGGNNSVTSSTGYKLLHGTSVTLTLDASDALYGISSASTPTIHFLESGT